MKQILSRSFPVLLALILNVLGFQGSGPNAEHAELEALWTLNAKPMASVIQLAPRYESERQFMSKVYESETDFELLGLNWMEELPTATQAHLQVRFRAVEGSWTEWQDVHPDQDGAQQSDGLYTYFVTEKSNAFQYKGQLSTSDNAVTPKIAKISYDAVSGGEQSFVSTLSKLVFDSGASVVSRKSWGADESLRLAKSFGVTDLPESEEDSSSQENNEDPTVAIEKKVSTDADGNDLWWPEEYAKSVKKIIIHHTATTSNLDDPEAAIRAIYYYHAVSRKWGDIGYNFIVAPNGKVYEGRAGGAKVVGAHAAGYNTGSVGVALLGNYQDSALPADMMKGLTGIVYEKAKDYGIDVKGSSEFRGESMKNLMGHRDVGSTTCPGGNTYDYLPDLRKVVGAALDSSHQRSISKDYKFDDNLERSLVTLKPGASSTVTLSLKNSGTETWDSKSYLLVNNSSELLNQVEFGSASKLATLTESSVAPGRTGTFSFTLTGGYEDALTNLEVIPIFNGSKKSTQIMDIGVFVERPEMDFSVLSSNLAKSLKTNEEVSVTLKLTNDGNAIWTNTGQGQTTLVTTASSSLVSSSTLATLTESSVKPGGTGSFTFKLTAPSKAGSHTLYVAPTMAKVNPLSKGSTQLKVKVADTSTSSSSTDDASVTQSSGDLSLQPGESQLAWVQVKNISSKTWSTSGDKAFSVVVTSSGGVEVSTPKVRVKSLSPKTSTKVYFTVTAPTEEGDYKLSIRPRLGSTNLTSSASTMKVAVSKIDWAAATQENPIRIKLTPDEGVGTPILTSANAFALYDDLTKLRTFEATSRVRVTPANGQFTVSSGSLSWTAKGPLRFISNGDDGVMEVASMNQRPAWNEELNDNQFRGIVELRTDGDEAILINELPLEDYLKGIGEVSNNTHEEKIKTMMVLARSYAYYYMTQDEKFPGKAYNLDDDPDTSQKYLGYGFEKRSDKVSEAVKATANEVVTHKGKVVKTPYFSQSDGVKTKSAKAVWGWTDTPWLVSVADTYCKATSFLGHGVGLSGCGADAMAKEGWKYEDIIQYYYTDVDVSNLSTL